MAVTVDSRVPAELLGDIAGRIGAREARAADLNPL
jgi:D-3-phosphoglycerate dehydrogenase